MFDSSIKDWIRYNTEDYCDSDMLTSSIDELDAYIEYIHDNYNDEYYTHLIEMSEANDLKKRQLLKDFADIESFMGRMGGILNLKTSERFKPFFEHEKEQWTLAHLYKQAFEVVDEYDNLNRLSKPDALERLYEKNKSKGWLKLDKKYHYLLIYGFRNTTGSHFDEEHNLAMITDLIRNYDVGFVIDLYFNTSIKSMISLNDFLGFLHKEGKLDKTSTTIISRYPIKVYPLMDHLMG